jgi:hypothetical protein
MEDDENVGDIAACSQLCVTAFKELLQRQTKELADRVIHVERNANTITGLPKNQQLSATNDSSDHGDLGPESLSMQSSKTAMQLHEIEVPFARFKIWAGNIGALQRGSSSLDVRLRESNVMRVAIIQILKSLQDTLNECKCSIQFRMIRKRLTSYNELLS